MIDTQRSFLITLSLIWFLTVLTTVFFPPEGTVQIESVDCMASPPQVQQLGPTSISCKALIGWVLQGHQQSEPHWIKLREKPVATQRSPGIHMRHSRKICSLFFVCWVQLSFSHSPNKVCIFLSVCMLNQAYQASLGCLGFGSLLMLSQKYLKEGPSLSIYKIPSAVCIHHKQTSCNTFSLRSALKRMLTDWANVCHQKTWAYLKIGVERT